MEASKKDFFGRFNVVLTKKTLCWYSSYMSLTQQNFTYFEMVLCKGNKLENLQKVPMIVRVVFLSKLDLFTEI